MSARPAWPAVSKGACLTRAVRTFTSASVGIVLAAGMTFQAVAYRRRMSARERGRHQSKRILQPDSSQKYTELNQEAITHAFVDHVYRGGAGAAFTSGGGGGGGRARSESGTPTSPLANLSRAFLMFVLIWWCTAGSNN